MATRTPPPGTSQQTWTGELEETDAPTRRRPRAVPGDGPLAGRYELIARIGIGGGGDVYRAWDRIKERDVAVKIFRPSGSEDGRARIRREVAALRLLDLPGVVRILDDGEDELGSFVVMELVDGVPFPGPDRQGDWEALRDPTISLLETLARIHDAGVVHRDIKPGNVLIDDNGRITILDFGLVRGDALGQTVTTRGHVVGTPRYLAPEQLAGEDVGPTADLYAVGVMLYEAISGRAPHHGDDLQDLWRAKLMETPTALHELVDDLPRQVSDAVARLLLRRPDERPQTAGAAIAALGGAPAASALPWLGSRDVVDAIVHAGRSGHRLRVVGPPGSGRSRALQEAAEVLEGLGVSVAWARPGARPFESLRPLLGDPKPPPGARTDGVRQAMTLRLQHVLDQGTVLLVDHPEELDAWTAKLLHRARGAVIHASTTLPETSSTPAFPLRPLTVPDLAPLFEGPDRILHLREDAAEELHRRTGGRPDQVEAEVRAWVRAGLASWSGPRLSLTRASIDRLRSGVRVRARGGATPPGPLDARQRSLLAWAQLASPHATVPRLARLLGRELWEVDMELEDLDQRGAVVRDEAGGVAVAVEADLSRGWTPPERRRAHDRIADELAPGTEDRLYHLLLAGRLDEVAAEAVARSQHLRATGRVGEALAVLTEALRAVRREGARGEDLLLPHLVRTAVASESPSSMRQVRYEVARGEDAPPEILALLDTGIEAWTHLAALEHLPPFEHPFLELSRQVQRIRAYQFDHKRRLEVLAELRSRPDLFEADPDLEARLINWEGQVAYMQRDHERAAALHERSAEARTEPSGRLSSRINAAMAWVEACRFDRAEQAAEQALQAAATARHASYEARATWVLRTVAARRMEALPPDLELVEAVSALGNLELTGTIAHTEAILALRCGDPGTCLDLATRALAAFEEARIPPAMVHARALRVLARGRASRTDAEELLAGAAATPMPIVALDVLGALATVGALPPGATDLAERSFQSIPEVTRTVARGMMSPATAIARVREVAARGN